MIPTVSQDPEVIEYCTNFDAYLKFVNQTEQDLRVHVDYEVDTDLLVLSVKSTLPAISEVELASEKYNATSSNFNVETQTLILETQLEDFEVFEAEINLVLGQQKFPFTIEIDPTNPIGFTDVLDLPQKPISWDNKKTENVTDNVIDYKEEIISDFQDSILIGDVVTLTKHRVGRVCYIGELQEQKKGVWYGVDLFLGTGKHDGVVAGKRYFQGRIPTSGCFVRKKSILALGICGGDATLKPRMEGVKRKEMHGLMVEEDWLPPIQVVTCDEENRPGYNSMPSHEYRDDPRTLQKKVAILAELVRSSSNFMAYTGAGISTTAGIDDYASQKSGKQSKLNENRKKVKKPRYAKPTLGHRVLTELYHTGNLKHWVQQNHDGLPQKAGYPQHELNEIHGGWWDVSNTVIPMNGSLRDDLFTWMCEWQKKADLTLAMGTSLCGMNADDCVSDVADRFRKEEKGFGSIIVGLQRTPMDKISSIRFYGTIDEIVALLAREMDLMIPPYKSLVPDVPEDAQIEEWIFKVPYDSEGKLTTDPDEMIIWDLRKGKKIVINAGAGKGFEGTITGFYPKTPHLAVATLRQYQNESFGKEKKKYYMGNWWVETITKGLWHVMPMVNKKITLQKDWEQKTKLANVFLRRSEN